MDGYVTINPTEVKLLMFCIILFLTMIALTLISIILNIKKKNKKRTIYQAIISVIALIGSFCIVGYSIQIFSKVDSDLYSGLVILITGNILTLINILKK